MCIQSDSCHSAEVQQSHLILPTTCFEATEFRQSYIQYPWIYVANAQQTPFQLAKRHVSYLGLLVTEKESSFVLQVYEHNSNNTKYAEIPEK